MEEIEKLKERVKHLQSLANKIESSSRHEGGFDGLYKLLKDEYELEGGSRAIYIMGNYRHNLEQTIDKQADTYIYYKKKRPKKGAPSEYSDFVRNFSQDVTSELSRCEYRLSSALGENKI